MGALFELYIEFEDGFAQDWGFSPGDAYADILGAAWPVAQYYVEPLRHIQPKYSYFPSPRYRGTGKFAEGIYKENDYQYGGNIFDDYEGQTYWIAFHVDGLLPESMRDYWPDWLGIALGVSIRDMGRESWEPDDKMQTNVILALDYDMTKIIPGVQ